MKGFEVRRALRHDGPARQRPAPPVLQRRARAARERARRARRGLPDRDAGPQQRAPRRSAPARSALAKRLLDLAIDHVKDAPPVRPAAGRLRHGRGEDRLDGLLPVRPRVDGLPDHRPGRRRASRTTRSSRRWRKVTGTEFVWYPANRAMQLAGGAGYMRDQPYEQILRDIRIFPIFEGANDVMRSFIALSVLKPLGDELKLLGDVDLTRPDRLDRRAGRATSAAGSSARSGRTRSRWPTTQLSDAGRRRSPTRSSACARSPRGCCARTGARSPTRGCTTSAWPTRSPTSTRRSPCSPA